MGPAAAGKLDAPAASAGTDIDPPADGDSEAWREAFVNFAAEPYVEMSSPTPVKDEDLSVPPNISAPDDKGGASADPPAGSAPPP